MILYRYSIVFGISLGLGGALVFGQTPPPAILEVDVSYLTFESDVPDYSKLASDGGPTMGVGAKNFSYFLQIGDIVAVNGKPAKGTWVSRGTMVNLNPNPSPGQAIGDVTRSNIQQASWEIQTPDGKPVGTIFANGTGGGPAPPGAPLIITQGNQAVTGGTGAFLGVRGQNGSNAQVVAPTASVTEDPANRRLRKGGTIHQILYLIPMSYPAIVTGANGPLVVHASDYSPVTFANPATAGEILVVIASGLGPTRPGIDPGKPFRSDQLYIVNSPVQVMMNGLDSEVLYAGGYPNATDRYQVNFRVPSGVSPGLATLQVSAAWIAGAGVPIAMK